MLVLGRKRDEEIVFRDRHTNELLATLRVVDVQGNKVKLGFDAPAKIVIVRKELEKKNAES